MDPNGQALDTTKLQSAAVVEEAMKEAGIDLQKMDVLRRGITVKSVLSSDARNRMALYYNILDRSASTEAVKQLLDINLAASQFIISFNYKNAGLTREEGAQFLNSLLNAYRSYYERTYNYSDTIGTTLKVINYNDYDYSEQVTLFSDALNDLQTYISTVMQTDTTSFRSSQTGYTFDNLLQQTKRLRTIELDRVTSFVSINCVTKESAEQAIAYYEWQIRELNDSRTIEEARKASLTDSIAAYERDLLVYTANGEAVNATDASEKDTYDTLVQQKLNTQNRIASYTSKIDTYEKLIEGLRVQNTATQSTKDKAEEYLADLSEKVNRLVENVRETADEYYEKASLANTVKIQVPAVTSEPKTTLGSAKKYILIAEAVVLVFYLGAACICGIRESNPEKRLKKTADTAGENRAVDDEASLCT
jgi:uncharacterized coiled-coil protein SlyX